MNTINTLAKQWWNELTLDKQNLLLKQYEIDSNIPYWVAVEMLFYNEVILVWFQSHGLYELCKTMDKDQIIAAYLEEYTKEETLQGNEPMFDTLNELCEKANLPKIGTVEFNDLCKEMFGGSRRTNQPENESLERAFQKSLKDTSSREQPIKLDKYYEVVNNTSDEVKQKVVEMFDALDKQHTQIDWISCDGYSAQEYPDFKKGWGVECFNGTKGTVEAYHNPYLYIEGQIDKIHKMNVKAYMTFEQPQSYIEKEPVSVLKTIPLDENCSQQDVNGDCSFPNCDCKTTKPKAIEDNEDLIIKFFYYLKYDKGIDTLEDSFMNDFKQHYTLIKK